MMSPVCLEAILCGTSRYQLQGASKAYPSASTRMRSLETAATAGVVIVLALAGIIVVEALRAGLPAIASGELPLWRLKARGQVTSLALALGSACVVTSAHGAPNSCKPLHSGMLCVPNGVQDLESLSRQRMARVLTCNRCGVVCQTDPEPPQPSSAWFL